MNAGNGSCASTRAYGPPWSNSQYQSENTITFVEPDRAAGGKQVARVADALAVHQVGHHSAPEIALPRLSAATAATATRVTARNET
jgi:hypothetical protein